MSNSLRPHRLQPSRPPCPSPAPRPCSNSRPLSQWCHPTILSSVIPFSSCLQSFPAWGSFLTNQFFASDGQSIAASASTSVLPMNIQDWFPLGLAGLILQFKGLSRVFSKITVQNHQFFDAQPSLWSNSHIQTRLLEKTKVLTIQTFVGKVISLIFKTLARFVKAFLPKSKHLLVSWVQSPSTVILEPKEIVCHCFHCFPSYLPWNGGTGCHDLCFLNVELKANFFTLIFHCHQETL